MADVAQTLELGASARYDITYRALVMGILNRTPDSFYDRGDYFDFDAFLAKADTLVAQGADFLDVGGVKAGPGPEVSTDEELERSVPAVEALVERFGVPVSIDTWNPVVLEAALTAGAVVGNDISGFAHPDYLPICAKYGASVVATHIRLGPRVPDPEPVYVDVLADVRRVLAEKASDALRAGIPQSLALLRSSDQLAALGFPSFLSASNKRFLGELVGTEVSDRHDATLAAHALGVALGCRILRSHDVAGSRRVADTMAAVLEARAERLGSLAS
jgi:dihydropteroate synthase